MVGIYHLTAPNSNRQERIYSASMRYSMSVGPWAVSFGALVPLHESHSESGRLMNYNCAPAVTSQ